MDRTAPLAFSYHRAIAPTLWVLVTLSSIELVVVHGLIATWSWPVAGLSSAASLAGIGWIVALIRSMKRLPVLLGPDELTMRVGGFRSVAVPLDEVTGPRSNWDGSVVKTRTTLNLALVAYPNVAVGLRRPLPGKRRISTIAHRLDDPVGFATALESRVRELDQHAANDG